ncbi:MAG TPA: CapA family protein [Candidatus Limnocylindrales bacterium]|nr:CapA family protein [Candidatus Limnocylindrales bacterium]
MPRRPEAGIVAVIAAIGVAAVLIFAATGTIEPNPVGLASAAPSGSVAPTDASSPGPTDGPAASSAPSNGPASAPSSDVAIVPVTSFRQPWTGTDRKEVAAILAGESKRYEAIVTVAGETEAVLAALRLERPDDPARLAELPTAKVVSEGLAKKRNRLAFLRASDVTERVRALAWEGTALFGVGRVEDLATWSLTADLPAAEGSYDPATAWTIVAGGDILLDRGVARQVKVLKKGVDFPFDGRTADITSRVCCSGFGHKVPRAKRVGEKKAVRSLLEGADLAMANFENPAPDRFTYHTKGTVFSADPALIEGLANAGVDYVSLGNNHIRDARAVGITQTRKNLKKWGIAYSGAGKNLAEARQPAMLEVGDTTVAVLGYDTIARYYAATKTSAGSAQASGGVVKSDIARARAAGADLVIVYPHWGTEYDATPTASQRRLARAMIDAGADMVIGNHAHWAGAMEIYKGRPIWYALGNLVFDQAWSEPTMEGLTLELTFSGTDLVQIRMRPHLILDQAQPNFLDPAGDGKVVMNQVWSASKGLLPW